MGGDGFCAEFGIRTVINATGPWTVVGNSAPAPRVLQAMEEMAGAFVPIAELQSVSSAAIAAATGAEVGYVTPGAASAVTLSVAALAAGLDVGRLRALPQLDAPNTVVLMAQHRGFYDIALRAVGARLRNFDGRGRGAVTALEQCLGDDVVCVFYDATAFPFRDPSGLLTLQEVVAIAHRHGVRVVVDASLALPPPGNLRALVATGADAVCFSGGKAIQGPSASGFVACRADMIRSIGLQHQDVNIAAALTGIVDENDLFMGIGRGFKVGKEQIAGLLVALEDYARRDHGADCAAWERRLGAIETALSGAPGVRCVRPRSGGEPTPYLHLHFAREGAAEQVSTYLLAGTPRVFVAAARENVLWVGAECMSDKDAELVGAVLRAAAEKLKKE
jgi:D-glucosaminate-6-phosphate ammonia-lyase